MSELDEMTELDYNALLNFDSGSGSETVPQFESDFWVPDPNSTWSPVPGYLADQWHNTSTLWDTCSIIPTTQLHHGSDPSTLDPAFLTSMLPPISPSKQSGFPQPGVSPFSLINVLTYAY